MTAPITLGKLEGFKPGRLWSLWDMLCEFRADAVVRLVSTMSRVATVVNSHELTLQSIAQSSGKWVASNGQEAVPREMLQPAIRDLSELADALATVNAPLSVIAIDRLKGAMTDTAIPFTYGDMERAYSSLQVRVRDELSLVTLLTVSAERKKYYQGSEPIFGSEVANKFASAAFEIDEAGKCLALERSTASVFHLMRVMEVGVRALARCLGVPDPLKPAERNWGNILKEVWAGIEKKWPTAAHRMHGEGALFEALHASLDAVKNPWRNATMHVENKYTDDEAEHILIAVRGFMKKLASRMDADGKPLA